ncbi:hypothetical protein OAM70_03950 [Pelagibacteraceae bacterium]|nr:hypothetical protein [Pelagibacteraceae bacterium]
MLTIASEPPFSLLFLSSFVLLNKKSADNLDLSNDAYEEIFKEIDISNLVEKKGIIYVWTNKNLKK